ncbi:RNA polymerase sigma factor [Vulgatibacter sp.]|uniref:RNA polymerase sigma factor n=1 Tax=Vulgatibacter sp. TaxID=1971226 RepID=UPI0035622447
MSRPRAAREEIPESELLDRQAVEWSLAGDREAFAQVVVRHGPSVHALCMRMVRNTAVAEELAQETFAKGFAALASFRQDAQLRHWLLRIAVNLCRDHLKAGERREGALDDEDLFSPVDPDPDPERRVAGRQAVRALEEAIGKLPEKYREAFLLKHVEDLSYEEIQAVVGGQIPMLKVRVFRAREMLRKLLGDE